MKPMFKAKIGWKYTQRMQDKSLREIVLFNGRDGSDWPVYRVRVTDARELTPEQAIARMGTAIREASEMKDLSDAGLCDWIWRMTGYSARVVNGKVRVRRVKK